MARFRWYGERDLPKGNSYTSIFIITVTKILVIIYNVGQFGMNYNSVGLIVLKDLLGAGCGTLLILQWVGSWSLCHEERRFHDWESNRQLLRLDSGISPLSYGNLGSSRTFALTCMTHMCQNAIKQNSTNIKTRVFKTCCFALGPFKDDCCSLPQCIWVSLHYKEMGPDMTDSWRKNVRIDEGSVLQANFCHFGV